MHDDDTPSNPSPNRPFEDVAAAMISRRSLLVGGVASAALGFVSGTGVAGAKGKPAAGAPGQVTKRTIGFTSIPLDDGPMPTIAPEYQMQVILPWREKLDGSGESFDLDTFTADEQERSVGIGHDGMWYFGDDRRGVLCMNNEFGDNTTVIRKPQPESLDDVRLSQAAHGVTIAMIEKTRDGWRMVPSPENRRIHGNTPATVAGPVAGSELLENPAGNPVLGTLNNCASGHTPWGTYLTCEENFNGYFGATGTYTATPERARYGLTAGGFGYGWHVHDPRFDLTNADYANEANRFGWVVEVDPHRPDQPPVKRTALGRVKHEGATVVEGRGRRAVVYMGDDERFDYIYKFVSRSNWKSMRARGIHPLDEGTLYVARFDDDGTGQWLELSPAHPALADKTLDWILVHTRLAADAVGATPMDRPEWIAAGAGEEMFCTLTNNSLRKEPDAANPLAPNRHGHIIRWVDADHHVGTTFEWDIFAIAQDVTDEAGQMFGSPDGIWADPDGRVFVQTDGGQPGGNNDQMLVADPVTAEFKRLLTGVKGSEVTGVTVTPDRRTMFVNIQHPGNGNPAVTNFPEAFTGPGGPVPRDATIVLTRTDGGIAGS